MKWTHASSSRPLRWTQGPQFERLAPRSGPGWGWGQISPGLNIGPAPPPPPLTPHGPRSPDLADVWGVFRSPPPTSPLCCQKPSQAHKRLFGWSAVCESFPTVRPPQARSQRRRVGPRCGVCEPQRGAQPEHLSEETEDGQKLFPLFTSTRRVIRNLPLQAFCG